MAIFSLLVTLLLFACASESPEKIPDAAVRLKLANGNPISDGNFDDYNPVIVQHANGYLTLVFGSNRTCLPSVCTGHNVFIATSVSAYNTDGSLPAFNTPQLILDNGTPPNLPTKIKLAPVTAGTQINVYFQSGASLISQTNNFNPVSSVAILGNVFNNIPSSSCWGQKFLGLDSAGLMLAANAAGTQVYRFDATSGSANCTSGNIANIAIANSVSITPLRPTDTGIADPFFIADSSGDFRAHSLTSGSTRIKTFTNGLAQLYLNLTSASVFRGTKSTADLLIFSAAMSGKTSDLYVLTDKTPIELWKTYLGYGVQPSY